MQCGEWAPATIGAITWLSQNERTIVPLIECGLVLSLLGSDGAFTFKRSRQQNSSLDKVVSEQVWKHGGTVRDFAPFGYDERQFCSPGFDLAVGCLTRTPHGEFPEYHTSDDNLSFISGYRLSESLELCERVVKRLEQSVGGDAKNRRLVARERYEARAAADNTFPVSRFPKGEPFLAKHDLYRAYGQQGHCARLQQAVMWVLNLSDGRSSIGDIARRSQLEEREIKNAITLLVEKKLIEPLE